MKREEQLKADIVEVGRRLWARGYVASNDGNISVRLDEGRILTTAWERYDMFRLREKGIKPVRGGATGDLFCRVVLETPVSLTREQTELLQKFEASLQKDAKRHHPREESWLDGVKHFFTSLGD